jgi:hypothetical protein
MAKEPSTVPSEHLKLDVAILRALDAWIAEQPDPKPTHEEAILLALRDWLIALGKLPFDEVHEGLH